MKAFWQLCVYDTWSC